RDNAQRPMPPRGPAREAAAMTAPARRRRGPRATRTSGEARLTTQRPARRKSGRQRALATTKTRISTATSITTTEMAGRRTRRADGKRAPAIRRGPIANRKREAQAKTGSVRARMPAAWVVIALAVVALAAAIDLVEADSATEASGDSVAIASVVAAAGGVA